MLPHRVISPLLSLFPNCFVSVVKKHPSGFHLLIYLRLVSFCVCMLSGKSLDNSSFKAQSSTSSQPDSSQGSSAAVHCKSAWTASNMHVFISPTRRCLVLCVFHLIPACTKMAIRCCFSKAESQRASAMVSAAFLHFTLSFLKH